jgi:hypothetical protein
MCVKTSEKMNGSKNLKHSGQTILTKRRLWHNNKSFTLTFSAHYQHTNDRKRGHIGQTCSIHRITIRKLFRQLQETRPLYVVVESTDHWHYHLHVLYTALSSAWIYNNRCKEKDEHKRSTGKHSMFRQHAINLHTTKQLTTWGMSENRVRRRESTGLRTPGATAVSTRCRECWASLDSSLTRPCARSGSNVSTTWRDQRRHRSSLSRHSLSTTLSSSRTCFINMHNRPKHQLIFN